MKRFALAAFAMIACLYVLAPASAETYSRTDPSGKLTLTKEPCKLGGWFAKWRAARWTYQGKPYDACWNEQDGFVVIVDSAGIVSVAPPQHFRKDDSI